MIVNCRPGFSKDADFEFFRTNIKSGQSFAERNKWLGEVRMPSVKIAEELQTILNLGNKFPRFELGCYKYIRDSCNSRIDKALAL